jgi:hypothetical protein
VTTTFDIVETLWKKLDGSTLKAMISGSIRKHERPAGSSSEDIVVNALPAINDDLQVTVANVNIYVPDLVIDENEVQEKVPDTTRMKVLANEALKLLNDVTDGDFNYDVQQQSMFEDSQSDSHFINIRINFYAINLN